MININEVKQFQGYLAVPECGFGPGLILIQEIFGVNSHIKNLADSYAKEGYVVLAPDIFYRIKPGFTVGYSPDDMKIAFDFYNKFDHDLGLLDLKESINFLRKYPQCNGKIGVMGFCLGGNLAYRLSVATDVQVDCAISYYGGGIDLQLGSIENLKCPIIFHFGAKDKHISLASVEKIQQAILAKNNTQLYIYEADHGFNCDERVSYDTKASMIAKERSLAVLRSSIGPAFDLNSLWEEHTKYEFTEPNVKATIATMTDNAYVNHIPTLTGGQGKEELLKFYRDHFISHMPADTRIFFVSRTVSSNRVIDEMIFSFTHDSPIEFMLPGVKPTGKYVEVPLVALVTFEGNKIKSEHIYFDQACVLVQIGLLNSTDLPVFGSEVAKKVKSFLVEG